MKRVKITSLPKAYKGGSMSSLYKQIAPSYMTDSLSETPIKGKKTLGPVPEGMAKLEAEKGETALIPDVGGLPAHYRIGGKRHSQGGTPLNLPENSFIFSDTAGMRIKDPKVLEEFGMPTNKKGGYTPAQVAERYDINKFREVLSDPHSDKISRETAEKMIASYNVKLAKLALVQESMKGFPDGIPMAAMPYLAMNAVQPKDVLPLKEASTGASAEANEAVQDEENPTEQSQEEQQGQPLGRFGGTSNKLNGHPLLRKVYAKMGGAQQRFRPDSGIFLTMSEGGPIYTDGHGTQWSHNNSDINIPAVFANGGQPHYDDGGTAGTAIKESKPAETKVEDKDIKEIDDPSLAVGDYYKDKDGKVRKVTKINYNTTRVNQSLSGSDNYKPKYGDLKTDVVKANEIMDRLAKDGYAEKDKNGNWTVYRGAADKLSISEKDFLTSLASYNKDTSGKNLGAPGFNIAKQSTYVDKKKATRKNDGFYGYADPAMVEFRYWQAKNPDADPAEFDKLDNTSKVANRKEMLQFYGYDPKEIGDDKLNDPSKLYTPAFITNKENGLVKRNQQKFEVAGHRPQLGDDNKFGLEHMDRYHFGKEPVGEEDTPQKEKDCPEGMVRDPKTGECVAKDLEKGEIGDTKNNDLGPEWWLQDAIKTAGAAGDMANIKKYMPWAPKVSSYIPNPTFYDPTRELAANMEQMNIGAQGAAAYAPSQAYNSRMSQMAGQGAKAAADVLGRYNNLNVSTANEFEGTKAQIFNQTGAANAEIAKNLYDQATIANQQYDNSKNQARQELRQSYIDAITNKEQAYAMNQVYPNYQVSPSLGGRLYFKEGDKLDPKAQSADQIKQFMDIKKRVPDITDQAALKLMGLDVASNDNMNQNYLNAMQNMYPGNAGLGNYYEQGPTS
jgi:hypothetical protein